MNDHSKALKLINRLAEKFGKGGYIFRGTSTRYSLQKGYKGIRDGINSTLYRWVVKENKKGDIAKQQKNLTKIFFQNDSFSPFDMEKEIVENARKHFPSNTESHEILTELQHFGGKTNMIDFTRSMYVALFFACQGDFKESGEIIALHEGKEKFRKIKKIDYNKRPSKEALEIIDPAGAQSSQQRVHFQSGVFVRPADGYINPKECEKFRICGKLKKHLLEYLRVFHNLTENTVYNDLHGFIKNERNNETSSLYIYLGLASHNNGNLSNALKYYTKGLRQNPNSKPAYYHRGITYMERKEFDLAVKDFCSSIKIEPDYDSYFHLGNACFGSKDFFSAIENYTIVIGFRPDYAEAYCNRGKAYTELGDYNLALADLNDAVRFKTVIKPNMAFVLFNRGVVLSHMGNHESAIEDFNEAIKINPYYGEMYYRRGMAKLLINDTDGAKADYAKAKELGYPEEEE